MFGDLTKSKKELLEEVRALRARVQALEAQDSSLDAVRKAADVSGQQYRSLFENAGDSIFIIDPQTRQILDLNFNAARRLGFERDELIGRKIADIEKPIKTEPNQNVLWESTVSGTTVAEFLHERKDGSAIPVEVSSRLVRYGDKTVLQCFARDISERKRILAELHRLATTDTLTGLFNRRHFFARAEALRAEAVTTGKPLCVVMMDIDNFKRINDTYGHAVGDAALIQTAHTVESRLRSESDIFGRIGGEEFAALLPGALVAKAAERAEEFRVATAAMDVAHEALDVPLKLTVSFGVAQYAYTEGNIEPALRRADHALYRAKRSGRNRVEVATTDD